MRILIITSIFFWISSLWGLELSYGRTLSRAAISIFITVLVGYIVWVFAKAHIEQKLKEVEGQSGEEDEDNEEGAGGTRSGTLLTLMKKVIFVFLFIIVALIILSAIGVNIGPLLAGAGIIGIAIGFGAQTLVKRNMSMKMGHLSS